MTTKSKGSEFWTRHVEAASVSGSTLLAYAQEHGVSVHTLRHWRRKLRDEASGLAAVAIPETRRPSFVALKVATPGSVHPRGVALTIGSEIRLHLDELPPPTWLAEISLAMRSAR